jgi:hypothetical protein
MINQPTVGLDPEGSNIAPGVTPDLPGFFLSFASAEEHRRELKDGSRRYRIVERGVRACGWSLSIWLLVPRAWAGRTQRLNRGDQP